MQAFGEFCPHSYTFGSSPLLLRLELLLLFLLSLPCEAVDLVLGHDAGTAQKERALPQCYWSVANHRDSSEEPQGMLTCVGRNV
jgi:hypothetical protein